MTPGPFLYMPSADIAPEFRVIIRQDGRLIPFEIHQRTGARTGAALLDIAGRVTQITVVRTRSVPPNFPHLLTWRASVTDRHEIKDLVDMVLAGRVARGTPDTCAPVMRDGIVTYILLSYTLIFHMADGTIVKRFYTPSDGSLQAIVVPNLRETMDAIFAIQGIRFTDCPTP